MPNRPLTLPLEVITHIFRLAFLPSEPPSLQPEPSPPRSTSHLLLVNNSIRKMCLPFFFRILTVAQPQDFVTFFGERGILVNGAEGRRRRILVEELRIVVDARFPITLSLPPPESPTSPWTLLHKLRFLSSGRLPRLVFHHHPDSSAEKLRQRLATESRNEDGLSRLLLLRRQDYRALVEGLHMATDSSEENRARGLLEVLWTLFQDDLTHDRAHEIHRLLKAFRPLSIHLPISYWHACLSSADVTPLDFTSCAVSADSGPTLLLELDATGFDSWDPACLPAELHSVVRGRATVCIVGMSKGKQEEAEAWILGKGKESATEERWDSSWTFEKNDGSTFFFDFANCWE